MKINILDKCLGCGACTLLTPEVFEIFNKKAIANLDKIDEFKELCIDAALNCPVNAISIMD